MQILLLGWGFPPNVTGGLDTAVAALFEEFQERPDVDVELVLPAEYDPGDRSGIHSVPTGDGDIRDRIGQLTETFVDRAAQADLVHTNDWFGLEPGAAAQKSHGVTWVSSFHSLSSERNRDPPKTEVEAEQRIVEAADQVTTVSEITRSRIVEQYGGDPTVIYNGFPELEPTGRDVKAERGIDGEMALFVGRHTHQKGIEHLLAAVERLSRDDLTLVVGGSGHLTEQLARFAELLEIEESVDFAGYVPEAELADYYASADVFVSPAIAEPFGIAVVEALSVDTPVVTTECGASEILPDECLVEVEPDSRSIAAGIQRALRTDGPIEYDERGWDVVAGEYLEYYRSVLD